MLYIIAQETDLKNYLSIIFTKHHSSPNILFLKKKNLYLGTNLKNLEKEVYERWEQRTMHTKFHADTASFPRTGYHLMKCISQNLWGRAEAAV